MCTDREKLKQHQTLRSDQLTDTLNKTTCLTGHLTASLQVHITWGRPRILFEEKHLDCLQGGKLVARSAQSSCWTPNFSSCCHCFHQPGCFLKHKTHRPCPAEYRDASAAAKTHERFAGALIPKMGVCDKVRGPKTTFEADRLKEWRMAF